MFQVKNVLDDGQSMLHRGASGVAKVVKEQGLDLSVLNGLKVQGLLNEVRELYSYMDSWA